MGYRKSRYRLYNRPYRMRIFQRVPIRALWNPEVPDRWINVDVVFVLCGSLNVATDVAIPCLPMPQLWKLKVSNIRKLQLTFMFLLGGL